MSRALPLDNGVTSHLNLVSGFGGVLLERILVLSACVPLCAAASWKIISWRDMDVGSNLQDRKFHSSWPSKCIKGKRAMRLFRPSEGEMLCRFPGAILSSFARGD